MIQKSNILLVDDEVASATSTAEFLETCNYKVEWARTGEEALVKVRNRPDLVLLDRVLTDIEGLEICRRIRADEELFSTPIIIVSALNMPAHKSEGLHVGADDYVAKPFDTSELLARIEAVLRRRNFSIQDQKNREELLLVLNKILDQEQVSIYFQPIFFMKSGKLLGMEALCRPPAGNLLSNPEFLFKSALSLGKYFELEMMSWRMAFAHWRQFAAPGKLFLNCSPYLVESERFHENVFFQSPNLMPGRVVLEITERLAIKDYKIFIKKLLKLKELGFEIAVDDVGTGFSGLETIAELNPNYVKIDMALVRKIHLDKLKLNIVEAIAAFCRKSGIITIAEGIEEREELDTVIELGVDAAQGFLLGKPSQEI